MKNLIFIALFFGLIFTNVWGQIISQYVDTDSGTEPKGIEIWNNTGSLLDFSTNNLVIEKGTNGGVPSTDYTLSSGTLAAGAVIVIGTSDMETITTSNGAIFHLKSFTFNGDDALVVKYGGITTDVFGNPEIDPGSSWSGNGVSTEDQNISLKSGITTGDTDGWTDPSERFETTSTNPSGAGGLEGFGLAPSSGGTPDPEPTNHVVSFAAVLGTPTYSAIDLTWNDNNGAQAASGFLILANTSGTFVDPVDGTPQSDDTDLSDNSGQVNVGSGVQQYSFTGLTAETQYYFKIYPYTNLGSDIDYKTDGTVPTANATTDAEPDLPNAWINELHYDNDGADEGEFVEIVIEDPSNYTISNFSLDLCNGSNGTSYNSKTLDDFTAGTPFTVNGKTFNIYYLNYPQNGIQNGDPDGLCLSYSGSLIQFLSYGGTFTAVGGPADGMLSTDIGITQAGDETNPVGSSIGLTGTGTQYSDFTWTTFSTASAGSQNLDQALPVELTSFTASLVKNSIRLQWKTATEIDNYGFEIERTSPRPSHYQGEGGDEVGGRGWELIGFIPGNGTSNSPKNYEFTDESINENGVYSYRLKQIDNNGTYEYSDIVEISFVKSHPEKFILEQNYPNPFNPTTHISFVIPSLSTGKVGGVKGLVSIKIYDVLGNEIAELVNEPKSPGTYEVEFDGSKFVSGIYFYQLSLEGLIIASKKMLLLK